MNKIREKIMGMAFFGPALVLLTVSLLDLEIIQDYLTMSYLEKHFLIQ